VLCVVVGVVNEGSLQKTSTCANGLKMPSINEAVANTSGTLICWLCSSC